LFIGQIGNTEQLAAVGLGNLMMYLFCSAFIYAITGSLETFASHAAGRDDVRECGLYMHRCLLIVTIAYIPITFALLNTETILVGIGMNAKISKIAHTYVVIHIPGLYIQGLFSSFEAVFSVLNYAYIVLIINLVILPFHVMFLYLFVVHLEMEISGCAYSFNISMAIAFLICLFFASYLEGFKDAWYFPTC
jgi:Na+-driven multidrug efflux pump